MVNPRQSGQGARALYSRYSPSDFEAVVAERASLLAEMMAIGEAIEATRQNIAALGVGDIHPYTPEAGSELNAIVTGSAEAADAILDTCERLDNAAAGMPDDCRAPIREATTRIFEACGFQDITGQRAAKVERILKLIDDKVAQIVTAFSPLPITATENAIISELEGPRRGGHGMDQVAVDALLASFG